jgi:hypothetical protein
LLIAGAQLPLLAQQNDIAKAQRQITQYLAALANIHCREFVVQQKLDEHGKVQTTDHASFDYLVMMNGDRDDFQLNESRIALGKEVHKPMPLMLTNGFSSLLLVFHPYYSSSFQFGPPADDTWKGIPADKITFTQTQGPRALAALALRGREFPMLLQGTAWMEKGTGRVLQMDASLENDLKDIGLIGLAIHVEYTSVHLGDDTLTVPSLAEIDLHTTRQHWRNRHEFQDYKLFGADAEQDPDVKVRTAASASPDASTAADTAVAHKETPKP